LGSAGIGAAEELGNTLGIDHYNTQQTAAFDNLKNFYDNRYGISDLMQGNVRGALGKIANTLYTDPAGAAADLSILLGGAGAVAGKIGDISDIAKAGEIGEGGGSLADMAAAKGTSTASQVGQVLSKVGEVANPFALAGKGVEAIGKVSGNVAAGILGNTSGIGFGTAKEFLTGNEAAVNAMRSGEVTEEGLVQSMQDAYQNMRKSQLADYKSAQSAISEKYPDLATGKEVPSMPEGPLTNGVFSQSDLRDIFKNNISQFGGTITDDGELSFKNSNLPISEQNRAIQMYDQIHNWSDLSPSGINNLENLVHDYYSQSASGNFQRLVIGADNGIKSYLREKIPEFQEADANYAKVSKMMNQVKKQLNVGGTAQPQTILNKILKVANNDEDMRNALLKEFSKTTGKDIEALAAGIKAHDIAPSGIFSKGLEVFGFFHPSAWIPLLTTSPRIAGEFLHSIGIAGEKYTELMSAIRASTLANVTSRVGNASNQIQKRKINITTSSQTR
ncbi:MAG: hypothetical protein KGL39_14800, partial [Patescibacteria group bacterium]|nr:hypothetical protein [Patescibacteria group bacterium]